MESEGEGGEAPFWCDSHWFLETKVSWVGVGLIIGRLGVGLGFVVEGRGTCSEGSLKELVLPAAKSASFVLWMDCFR